MSDGRVNSHDSGCSPAPPTCCSADTIAGLTVSRYERIAGTGPGATTVVGTTVGAVVGAALAPRASSDTTAAAMQERFRRVAMLRGPLLPNRVILSQVNCGRPGLRGRPPAPVRPPGGR